jgi:hypothetical protein
MRVICLVELADILRKRRRVQPNEAAIPAPEKTPHARGFKEPVAKAGVKWLALPPAQQAVFRAPDANAFVLE